MPNKENEKQEFEQIWNGLGYHVNELAKFMNEHENNCFISNEENETKMKRYVEAIICAYYLGVRVITRDKMSGLMSMIFGGMESKETEKTEETKKPEEGKETFSMEDMLKSVFGMNDKKDEEP